jgi:hypothetical protein
MFIAAFLFLAFLFLATVCPNLAIRALEHGTRREAAALFAASALGAWMLYANGLELIAILNGAA